MHVSTRAALLAATLVWATSASAQTYTLEEAVRTAVANSPQFQEVLRCFANPAPHNFVPLCAQ